MSVRREGKDVPEVARSLPRNSSAVSEPIALAWGELPELTAEAAFWIRKAGAEHYAEHLPRLRKWVAQLRSS